MYFTNFSMGTSDPLHCLLHLDSILSVSLILLGMLATCCSLCRCQEVGHRVSDRGAAQMAERAKGLLNGGQWLTVKGWVNGGLVSV